MKKKVFRRILMSLGIIMTVLLLLVGVGAALLCTEKVQQWLLKEAVSSLSERLNTRVEADSISVNPFAGRLSLYGFSIDDLQKTEMLHVDTLKVGIGLHHLLEHCIEVNDLKLCSTRAVLYKERKDTAANFQFVIDAFKKKHPGKAPSGSKDGNKLTLRFDIDEVALHDISVRWDVRDQKPKNYHKPHHGAFDANHLNATLTMNAALHQVKKDSMRAEILDMCLYDKTSGLDIRSIKAQCALSKNHLTVSDLQIKLPHTTITPETISMTIIKGEKSSGRKTNIAFKPFNLKANVLLKDIAKPFAPPLDRFSTPLNLSVRVGGRVSRITFDNILVSTPDKRLQLTAHGDLCNLDKDKTKLALHFRNIDLRAKNGIKEEIVKHFAHQIKLKMWRQMKAIGDIHFNGYLNIPYRREEIGGTLVTKFGDVTTDFVLNSDTKLMTGNLIATDFELGKLMNVKPLYPVSLTASFVFDISSKKHRANKHGRLPIGHLNAEVLKAKYGIIGVKDVHAEVTSDGAVADGLIHLPMKLLTITVPFTYTQTDTEQDLQVHPKFSLGRKEYKKEK